MSGGESALGSTDAAGAAEGSTQAGQAVDGPHGQAGTSLTAGGSTLAGQRML